MAMDIVYLHYYWLIRCYIHSEWLNHYYQSCFGIMLVDVSGCYDNPYFISKKN